MNYEKKYKEAIGKAAALYKASEPMSGCNVIIETLFPELKESEDEKIRKALINTVKYYHPNESPYMHGVSNESVIAWLEKQGQQKCLDDVVKEVTKNKETAMSFLKSCGIMNANGELADEYKIEQGEQKPADKVEPKFKVGDWLIFNESHNRVYQVERIDNYRYYLRHYLGGTMSVYFDNELIRLWTLQDAKDGDVLADYVGVILFRKIGNERYADVVDYYCVVNTNGRFEIQEKFGYWGKANEAELHPATKEQRTELFLKMHEAGYEWDAENLQLTKILHVKELSDGINIDKQKLAEWSEEDEKMFRSLHNLIYVVPDCDCDSEKKLEFSNWFKSLKGRVQPQYEWSEEEIEKAAQEWDSKANFNPFYMTMEGDKPTGVKQHITTHKESFKAGVNWILKFLKPQSIWKPSDKQMNVLWCHCSEGSVLTSLYNDLKKLKEG